jgi:hypothetical protein
MNQKVKILFLLSAVMGLGGCIKKDKFSKVPEIKFKEFILYQDLTGDLTFTFTDGDGDIGFNQEDTLDPFHRGGEHYYNFFMEYYVKVDNEFVKLDPLIPYFYRLPYLKPEGKNKTLQGTITVRDITPFPVTLPYDTVKFVFYMEDRSFNKSNTQMTPEIIRPRN